MKTILMMAVVLATSPLAFGQGEPPKPGKEHKMLAKHLGERTGTMKIWNEGPDGPAMEMPFKETNTSICNGFWVESVFESGPYNGKGLSGYNPYTKKYVGTWINNMSPSMSVMEGNYDEKTKELTFTFEDYDQATGKPASMKTVTSMAEDKPETMTMYSKNPKTGKWLKVFILSYDEKK